MKLSSMKLDVARIEAGDWVENIPDCGNLRIKTRGINCAEYRKMIDARLFALPKRRDPMEVQRVQTECLVAACLIDWNLTDENDAPIPVSGALAILTDPAYDPVRMAVAWAANQIAASNAETQEAAAKN